MWGGWPLPVPSLTATQYFYLFLFSFLLLPEVFGWFSSHVHYYCLSGISSTVFRYLCSLWTTTSLSLLSYQNWRFTFKKWTSVCYKRHVWSVNQFSCSCNLNNFAKNATKMKKNSNKNVIK